MSQLHFGNTQTSNAPPRQRLGIMQALISTYKLWREVQNHFPKKSRFTLGSRIDSTFVEIIEYVSIARYQSREKKLPYLQGAISKTDLLKCFLQVAWEVKDLDNKKYLLLSEPIEEIGRMLGGWYKKTSTAQKER